MRPLPRLLLVTLFMLGFRMATHEVPLSRYLVADAFAGFAWILIWEGRDSRGGKGS